MQIKKIVVPLIQQRRTPKSRIKVGATLNNKKMETAIEFYNWRSEQKNKALEMCNGDQELIKRISEVVRPIADNFKTEKHGYLEAPGFTASVLYKRAVSDSSYNKGMTVLQNENKLYA